MKRQRRCMITGTFTTVDELRQQSICNCGTSTVFCSGRETPVDEHNGHVNHLVQELHDKTSLYDHRDVHNVDERAIDQGICRCTQRVCNNLHSKRRPPYQCTATGESLWRTKGICICATTGMSTARSLARGETLKTATSRNINGLLHVRCCWILSRA